MRPRQIATLALCVPLVAVAQSPKTGVPQYEIAPPAGWVQPPPAFGAAYATGANASSGSEYLLVDRQARLDGAASLYSRFVVRPLNPAGVSSESQVSIVFDPEREHLRVHGVTVHRGIETVDELKRGRIEVLQRESGLEQGLLEVEVEHFRVRFSRLRLFLFRCAGRRFGLDGFFLADRFVALGSLPSETPGGRLGGLVHGAERHRPNSQQLTRRDL